MNYFDINFKDLFEIIKNHKAFQNVNSQEYWYFMKNRISYYFKKLLNSNKFDLNNINSYEELERKYPYFIGQIVYRVDSELKKMIEILRSKYLVEIWKKEKIFLLIYSIIPKGEMGIAPTINDLGLKYEIYECNYQGIDKPVLIKEKINAVIENNLVLEEMRSVR